MLTDKELIHYSRHIVLPQIDESGQIKLKQAKVLIVGLGGLGAPVAMYLAAAGVGNLYLADGDKVESSNLQRQIIHSLEKVGQLKVKSAEKTIQSLNNWTHVFPIEEQLANERLEHYIQSVDIVVDCSDNFDSRFSINQYSVKHKKPLISGAAIRFEGQLGVFNLAANSACYQCLYPPNIELNETCFDQGILSPVVGTIGTLQATEVIKVILGIHSVSDSQLMTYDALKLDFKKLVIRKDPHCIACSNKP